MPANDGDLEYDTQNAAHRVDSEYELKDLVDLGKLREVLDDFSGAAGFTTGLASCPDQKTLIATGWRDICTRFHQSCPASAKLCLVSHPPAGTDTTDLKGFKISRCRFGFIKGTTPVLIKGQQVATLFTGQVLLDQPDVDRFRRQADEFGFDPATYLQALSEVPVVTERRLTKTLSFLAGLATVIGELGLTNLKLRESSEALRKEMADRTSTRLALTESEQRFRSIIDGSPMGIHLYRLEEDGRLVFNGANPAADKILGTPNESFIGKTIEEAFPLLVYSEVPRRYRLAASEGIPWQTEQVEYLNERISGAYQVVAFQTAPNRMAAMFLDTTERTQAEEALRRSEDSFNKAQHVASLGSYSLNIAAGKWSSSKMLDQIFGIGPNFKRTIEGWLQIVHPEDREEMLDYFSNHVLAERRSFNREYRIIRLLDGSERWVHGLGELEFDTAGKPVRMIGTIQDITQNKEAHAQQAEFYRKLQAVNKQLKARQQELEEFTYTVSHDLKAPIVSMTGFASLLSESVGDQLDATSRRYIERIEDNARTMEGLLQDLLELSRIGRTDDKPTELCTNDLVDDIIDGLSVAAAPRGIELRRNGPLPKVTACERRLRQVLTNLLDNAIKYMPEGTAGLVEIGYNTDQKDISDNRGTFYVKDNGSGIPSGLHNKIFNLFQRGPGSQAFASGSGVGLAAARRIIEAHGGQIWLDSDVGRGATFYFTLPDSNAPQAGSGSKVLLAHKTDSAAEDLVPDCSER